MPRLLNKDVQRNICHMKQAGTFDRETEDGEVVLCHSMCQPAFADGTKM